VHGSHGLHGWPDVILITLYASVPGPRDEETSAARTALIDVTNVDHATLTGWSYLLHMLSTDAVQANPNVYMLLVAACISMQATFLKN
jgi:hypothetical protein